MHKISKAMYVFYSGRAFGPQLDCAMDAENPEQYLDHEAVDPVLSAREKALVWKQDLRIVPLCAFIYLLCYLDRSNIGESVES